jgi:cytochrome c5
MRWCGTAAGAELRPHGAERLYCAAISAGGPAGYIVSKQDTHFFNVFSMVIGLLVAVAIGLFALARIVASHTQEQQVLTEADYAKNVAARIAPPSQEAIAGQDNSALAIKAPATASAGSAAALPKNGTELFEQTCSACHGQGIGGAPRAGDKAAWGPRIAKGKAVLYEHAIQGFTGSAGVMPAKGGRTDVPDDLVKQAVDHMVQMAQ